MGSNVNTHLYYGRENAYICKFPEKANEIVLTGVLTERLCMLIFLQGFSDKVGNKMGEAIEIEVNGAATPWDT